MRRVCYSGRIAPAVRLVCKGIEPRMPKLRSILFLLALAAASPAGAQTPEAVAEAALRAAPVWDGHNDVPIQLRARYGNLLADFDFEDTTDTGPTDAQGRVMHTDFARLAEGRVGAQFWSVYVDAAQTEPEAVVETVEQIDVTKRLIARYPDRLPPPPPPPRPP